MPRKPKAPTAEQLARKLFDSLTSEQRNQLIDTLVDGGAVSWRQYFATRPPEGTWAELFALLAAWQEES